MAIYCKIVTALLVLLVLTLLIMDVHCFNNIVDKRTKPDIVAPGMYIASAGSRINETGECEPPTAAGLPFASTSSENYGVESKMGTCK